MPLLTSAATESAPIGPAPKTITESPGWTPERVMPCSATARGSVRAAARSDMPSGIAPERLGALDHVAGERTRMADRRIPSVLRFSH